MNRKPLDNLFAHLRAVSAAAAAGDRSDRELLNRFAMDRDEGSFAALVHRHGPMVLGVCRRALRNEADAEDALQATFLVLARKAASRGWQDSVAGWLHAVARKVASEHRKRAARRAAREAKAEVAEPANPAAVASWREVAAAIDEELVRLPMSYRAPVLLCCLEGKSRDEAASELGCESGAIKGRLERGRELLRKRLAKRGIAFSAPLLAVFLSPGAGQAALPPLVAVAALKAVSGTASAAGATALANVVLRGILLTKLKAAAAVVLAAGIVGGLSTAAVEWLPGSGGKAVPVVAAFRLPPERRDTTPPEVAAVDDEIDASPAGPQPPLRLGKPSLVARFEGIDVERGVALFIEKKEHAPPTARFEASPETEYVFDGRPDRLANLPAGHAVGLHLSPDKQRIVAVSANGPEAKSRTVRSVDAAAHTLTVGHEGGERSYPVDADARIVAPAPKGEAARVLTLSDLAPGTVVSVRFSVDRNRVTAITVKK